MNDASSEARNKMGYATSRGSPTRFSKCLACAMNSSFVIPTLAMCSSDARVKIVPGTHAINANVEWREVHGHISRHLKNRCFRRAVSYKRGLRDKARNRTQINNGATPEPLHVFRSKLTHCAAPMMLTPAFVASRRLTPRVPSG